VAYVGGGGLTLPRYVRATRPGSEQAVYEIDGDLVELVRTRLGFVDGADVTISVGDGRLGIRDRADASADVVVGDAFGGRAVPFHLATEEFLADVARVLRPGGLYAANIIDSSAQSFLRAEAATAARVFDHVVVVLGPGPALGTRGNSVILASDAPIDAAALGARLTGGDDGGEVVTDVAAFVGGAQALTDEFAPVDQLLSEGA
jgi:spermidine synthase